MSLGANYPLLTSLPMALEPDTPPPLSPAELRTRAADSSAAPLVDVVLLMDDLRQRQALLVGELTDVEPVVLTSDQVTGKATLPPWFGPRESAGQPGLEDDAIWEAYWHHAAHMARRHRSGFLGAWVRMEVGLRNDLAAARAPSLGWSPEGHQVAPHLGAVDPLIERGVAAWASAADPLSGWRSLLRTRWEWVTREEPRFTFSRDEVIAYAVKLLLLRDWRRTMGVAA